MTIGRHRLLLFSHVLLGLLFIPLGLGHLDWSDFLVRLPAVAVVGADALVALQIAIVYTQRIWPHRDLIPQPARAGMFHPSLTWAAAAGYYSMCLWVVMAIIARPDSHVDWVIGLFFVAGYGAVGVYKVGKLRLANAVARTLEGLDE